MVKDANSVEGYHFFIMPVSKAKLSESSKLQIGLIVCEAISRAPELTAKSDHNKY